MSSKIRGWSAQPYYKDYAYLLHGLYPLQNTEEEDINPRRPITLKGLLAPGFNNAGPFAVPHFSNTFHANLDREPSRVHAYDDLQLQWSKFQTRKYARELGWTEDNTNKSQSSGS